MARRQPVTAALNGSFGASFCEVLDLMLELIDQPARHSSPQTSRDPAAAKRPPVTPVTARNENGRDQVAPASKPSATGRSAQRDVHRAFRQLGAEAALVELGDDRPLQLVALVEEGD